jgi:hypothetical protein
MTEFAIDTDRSDAEYLGKWDHHERGTLYFVETTPDHPLHCHPRLLLGQMVRVDGVEFQAAGVEAHCVADGHSALRKFSLLKAKTDDENS